jgi:predicted Na+-dependent transporter
MLAAYARFMRERYAYVISGTLVLAAAWGLVTSAPGLFLRGFSAPLMVIMIAAMGFTITIHSLGMATKDWRAFSLGVLLNFALAPAMCWALARVFLSRYPDLAAGVILIGVVPCAGMALVWAGLLEGDVPLATVINAATMIAAPFLIPALMLLLAGRLVAVAPLEMFETVLYTVLLPLAGGLASREWLGGKVDLKPYLPLMPAISASAAVLLMFVAVNTAIPLLLQNLAIILPLVTATVIIFPGLFLAAHLVSAATLTPKRDVAITYSAGMKNLPIALGIAIMSLKGLSVLPVAVGFVFQMLTAVSFYQFFRRKQARSEGRGQGTELSEAR